MKKMAENNEQKKPNEVVLPEGFTSVIAERANNWFKPEISGAVIGTLKGRFHMTGNKGKVRYYYQIQLSKPCVAMTTEDDQPTEVTLEPGDLINVDERKDLEGLAAAAADSTKEYVVFIQAIEKIKLDSGNTFWRFAAGVKPA